ncbi:MAG: membrane associated rhomboid family serine protease [Saprospiraceae bacterium]|jgi:membrane associated rhomboid family serine protease
MSVTLIIIIFTAFITFSAFKDHALRSKLIFHPYTVYGKKEWFRLISHGFIHADNSHAFFNLFALWMFGTNVEAYFGQYFGGKATLYFIILYVGGIVAASLISLEKHKNNPSYSALGASGAVSAVVFSAIVMEPKMQMGLIFFPVMIDGWIFGLLYLAYSTYMSKKATDNIGHDAHIWGAVFGFLITIAFRPEFLTEFLDQIKIF